MPGPDQAPGLVHSHDWLLANVLISTWPKEMIRSVRSRHTPSDTTGGPTLNPHASWCRRVLRERGPAGPGCRSDRR
jgi:hypothetical protein